MGQITLQGVRKSFGPVNIIRDANLDIEDGSFVVFVGPSGCGKTTLLRLIAGLEDVTGGQILIDGRNVVNVPPAKRGLSITALRIRAHRLRERLEQCVDEEMKRAGR